MIEDEPDDVSGSGLTIEERVDSYGGWDDPPETLFRAVMAGDKQVVVALLDGGVDVNAVNKNGRTALMLAADDDQKLIARTLLENDATIDSTDADGLTALHTACSRGYLTLCILFVKYGANIEVKTLKGESPLHVAIRADRPHIVQWLVEHDCNLKAMGPDGSSILHLVITEANLGMLRILIDGGANVDIRDSTTGRTPLQVASALGNSPMASMLLDHGAQPNILDDALDSAFLIAAREGNEVMLKLLADRGADVNMKNSSKGNSALNEAAARPNSEGVVKALLELPSVDINQKNLDHLTPFLNSVASTNVPALKLLLKVSDTKAVNDFGYTALHLAAQNSTREVAQILIENGLDLHALNNYKITAFHCAVRCSNVAVFEYFLELGEDVNSTSGDFPWTALHHCCRSGNVATAKSLLAHGADMETVVPNDTCATPFLRAVLNNKIDLVEFLLDRGANINPKGFNGYTALHICACKNHPKICTFLLNRGGIDIEARNSTGMTPLLEAASLVDSEAVALIFINHGANTDVKAGTGENALRLLLRSDMKSLELLQILLEKEADINTVDRDGLTPLMKAVIYGRAPLVSAILAKNPNLEATNNSQMTSLNVASWKGFKEIVIQLLNAGADINHRDKDGASSLIYAAKHGQEEIVRLLIARGADVQVKNNKGQNTLDVAVEAKKTEVATMLMNMDVFRESKSNSTIHKAVRDNNVPLIELLLTKNPELLEEKDKDGYTPLHLSLLVPAQDSALTYLLQRGADLSARISNGETALMVAAWKNHKDGTLKLIEKSKSLSGGKCPIIFERAIKGWSPLHYAARWNNDTYIIKLLLRNGAEVDALDGNEVTPLSYAADQGRLEAIRVLTAAGANIDAKDRWGRTALMRTIKAKHVQAGQLLIELGASVQEKSYQYSMSALMFAVTWTDSVPLTEALLKAGATINDDLDNEECNPLTRAAVNRNRTIFEFLLTQGGNADVIDIFGQQPLQRAARISSEKGVEILLDAKADVHFKEEKFGMTALHYAARSNNDTAIAQMLLDHGADVNARDDLGTTPLIKAAFQNKKSMVKFLVQKGADLEARSDGGYTALLQMIKSEKREMV
jgi:serine/threonine-protein phosphatase 6 regulatory ankyrin repeat subunit A